MTADERPKVDRGSGSDEGKGDRDGEAPAAVAERFDNGLVDQTSYMCVQCLAWLPRRTNASTLTFASAGPSR